MLAYRIPEEVAALAVGTGVPDPPVVEEMPAFFVWNRWRPGWLVALAQVTHPKALTRLDWLSEINLLLDRMGGVPGVPSVIGLDEVPGLDAGGELASGNACAGRFSTGTRNQRAASFYF